MSSKCIWCVSQASVDIAFGLHTSEHPFMAGLEEIHLMYDKELSSQLSSGCSENKCNPLAGCVKQVLAVSEGLHCCGWGEWDESFEYGSSSLSIPESKDSSAGLSNSISLLSPQMTSFFPLPPWKGGRGANSAGMWHLSPAAFQGD